MKTKTLLVIFIFVAALQYLAPAQNNCNISTAVFDFTFYPGPATNFTYAPNSQLAFFLCNNAVVYDTLASNCTADRVVMISSGAKFVWKRCGSMASSIYVASGGTLVLLPEYFPTNTDIYKEVGATINISVNNTLFDTVTCTQIVFPNTNCSTSIEDLPGENTLNLHPNPSNGSIDLQISGHSFLRPLSYNIFDSYGKKVADGQLGDGASTLSTRHLLPGFYFLQIEYDNKVYCNKFVQSN